MLSEGSEKKKLFSIVHISELLTRNTDVKNTAIPLKIPTKSAVTRCSLQDEYSKN